jgi:hypothetical protein
VPYLTAAVTGRALGADIELEGEEGDLAYSGGGVTLGGGFQYFFTAPLALNAGVAFTIGDFTKLEFGGEEVPDAPELSATGGRVHLGLTWYPMVRR